MNEGRELSLEICFFGYIYDMVEDYINKNFIESGKEYAKKWTQVNYRTTEDGAACRELPRQSAC